MKRYAKQRDKSEPDIVKALLYIGASVHRIESDTRSGVPDLLVGYRGVDGLLEVKNPASSDGDSYRIKSGEARTKARRASELSEQQERWHKAWRGRRVATVRTPEEAVATVKAWASEGGGSWAAAEAGEMEDAERVRTE